MMFGLVKTYLGDEMMIESNRVISVGVVTQYRSFILHK